MSAVNYLQRVLPISAIILSSACGTGGGEDDNHVNYDYDYKNSVTVSSSCGDAAAEYKCNKGKVSPTGSRKINDGESLSIRVIHEPGHKTVVKSYCGAKTHLKKQRRIQSVGYYSQGVMGELTGDTFKTPAIYNSCSVSVHFLTSYEVTTDAGDHGTISPATKKMHSMSVAKFKIEPDDGYLPSEVSGCGSDGVLEDKTYTLRSVQADCQLTVGYVKIPDMEGTWSGTWEGVDSAFGPVSGTWVLDMSQDSTRLSGPIAFSGDLDCAEGSISGVADPRDQVIKGQVKRLPSPDPCKDNSWVFSAFDDSTTSASGSWSKSGLSNGAFEGRRIAVPDGPNIHYFYPPWAGAGDYVTVVGEKLDMDLLNDSLSLGFGGAMLVPESATESTIRLRLPGGIGTSQPLHLTTLAGSAISPLPLNTGVTSPDTGYTKTIELTESQPGAVVFSINNRRAFVANRGSGSVSMINTEHGVEFTSTPVAARWLLQVALHAIAPHPDGRRIYAAGAGVVGILHAHTMELLETLELPAYGGALGNPHGIAISPDGRWLLVSESAPGGRVSIFDIASDHGLVKTLVMPAGSTARGVAVNPANQHAYIAVSGSVNEVQVYDLPGASTLASIEAGESPQAIAVTQDGSRIYVSNGSADTVVSYDLDSGASRSYDLPSGASPNALAITPDGTRIFVTTSTNLVYVIDGFNESMISVMVGGVSSSIAISRDGRRAYVALPQEQRLVEIGNQRTLRISKQGGGLGTVTTVPDAIHCGSACSATFDLGTQVTLNTSQPPTGFRFGGWLGDADCRDGRVTMRENLYCVALFEPIPIPKPPSGGGGSTYPGSGSSNCFIATAAYGSWLDPHVMSLRLFRDRYLLTNRAGTRFVEFYYEHSPPVADFIREREWLRSLVRVFLAVVVFVIDQPLGAALGLWLLFTARIQRASAHRYAAVNIGSVDQGKSGSRTGARKAR